MASGPKTFYVLIAVVVVGGAAYIATRVGRKPISIPANVVVTTADTSGFRGYVTGSPNAPIEITEYGDLECPGCAQFATVQFPDVKLRLIDPGKVRWRWRDFPWDDLHKHPRIAAHAAACADEQGKYWQMQEQMFATQGDWALSTDPMPALEQLVKNVGGDTGKWQSCMQSAKYAGRIQASLVEGKKLGVSGTPSFLIGGRIYQGMSSDAMVKLVDSLAAAGSHTTDSSKASPAR